jgi:hypothetical protein
LQKNFGAYLLANQPMLEALDVGGCLKCFGKLGPELARMTKLTIGMGRSEHIPHLDLKELKHVRELVLDGTPICKAMDELVAWKTLKPRILRLPKTSIKDSGAKTLAAAKLDLDLLDVRANPIGADGAAALRAAYGDRVWLTDDDAGKPAKPARKPSSKPKQETYWDALGLPACNAWVAARGLAVAGKPKWYADVFLDVRDAPAPEVYWGDRDTRFHLKIASPEWSFLFCHANKTSSVRVRETSFVHGDDDWKLEKQVPSLDAIGAFLAKLEKKHGVKFRREHAFVRTNITGAKPVLRAWVQSL